MNSLSKRCLLTLFYGLLTASVCVANEYYNYAEKNSKQTNNGFILLILLFLCGVGSFLYWNKKFKHDHPDYEGKLMWSLIFFPILYIYVLCTMVYSDIVLISNSIFSNSFLNTLLVISMGAVGLAVYAERKIILALLDGNLQLPVLSKLIICVNFILPFTSLINICFMSENQYFSGYLTNSIWIAFAVYLICGGISWYFGNKKIKELSTVLGNTSSHQYIVPPTLSVNKKVEPQSSSHGMEQLLKLKKLHDEGILSDEEFNKMKQDILNRGL